MRLATQPSADVSVSVTSGDPGAATVDLASLTFTTTDWGTAQTVTVSGVADSDTGDESLSVGLSATGGDYEGETASVAVSVTDDDIANLVVSESSLDIGEDGSETFTVRLATQPSADVSVSVTSGDPGAATVDLASLTFTTTDWGTAQTVTVSGVADDDGADESLSVGLSATGGDYAGETASVAVSVTDDDDPDLVVDPTTLTVAEDGSGTFTVRLATQPSADVSVSVASGDPGAATVDLASLTFTTTDWGAAQTVTVSGVADDDGADESLSVGLSATGGDYENKTASVAVSVTDDDDPDLVVDPTTLTVAEDGSGTFTVRLATQPSADVSVSVASGDPGAATVDLASLTFTTTDWGTAQTVTVSGVADDDGADESLSVGLSATGGDYAGMSDMVSVEVDDTNAAPSFMSPDAASVDENVSSDLFTHALLASDSDSPTDTITEFRITGGIDGGAFSIQRSNTNYYLVFGGTPFELDHEGQDTYEVEVTVTSGSGARQRTASQVITISVLDLNDPPQLTSADRISVIENELLDHIVVAVDEDSPTEIVTYHVTGGTDQTSFDLDINSGVLAFKSDVVLDYESGDISYEIVVTARSGLGIRELSTDQTIYVTVLDDDSEAPGPPTVSIGVVTISSIGISWSTPPNTGPPITGYNVQYKVFTSQAWSTWPHPGTSREATITGLDLSSGNQFRVQAQNDEGTGPWSIEIEQSSNVPSSPRDLLVELAGDLDNSPGGGKLRASWQAPAYGAATAYRVYWWKTATETFSAAASATTSNHDYTIAGLENGIEYSVRVLASNSNGTGGISIEVTAIPLTSTEQLRQYIETKIVEEHETDHPWLRSIFDNLAADGIPIEVSDADISGLYNRLCDDARPLRKCTATNVELPPSQARSEHTIVHELAHGYTTGTWDDTPLAVGVGWLYVEQLGVGSCINSELYADVFPYVLYGSSTSTYWPDCLSVPLSPSEETLDVVRSIGNGITPDWFAEFYQGGDSRWDVHDLEAIWADVLSVNSRETNRIAPIWAFRNEFGGYCEPIDEVTDDAFASRAMVNPWNDGGCAPSAPDNLRSYSQNGGVSLSWDAPIYGGASEVDSYTIRWKSGDEDYDSDREFTVLIAQLFSLRPFFGFTNGTTYTISVSANNTHFGEGLAAEIAAAPLSLNSLAPQGIRLQRGNGELIVSWSDLSNGVSQQYRVDYKLESTTQWSNIADASSPTAISGLTNGAQYVVRVVLLSGGNEYESAHGRAVPVAVSDPPRDLVVVSEDDDLHLSWTSPVSNGGSPIGEYRIQWIGADDTTERALRPHVKTRDMSYTIASLDRDSYYFVSVTAVNAVGTSRPITLRVFTGLEAPQLSVQETSATSLAIAWTTPGATLPQLTGYEIEYRVDGTGMWTSWQHASVVSSASLTGLTKNTKYNIRVRAVNANGESSWSLILEVSTDGDDCRNDSATVCTALAGTPVTGEIELEADVDWYTIQLEASTRYRFEIIGGSGTGELAAPVVKLLEHDGSAVTVSGTSVEDADTDGDGVAAIAFVASATGTYYLEVSENGDDGIGTYQVSMNIVAPTDVTLDVDPSMLNIDEDNLGTFTVRLATQPTASVTVMVASGDPGAATVDMASLTFTTTTWGTAQTVTVSGVADDDGADESLSVGLSASSADSEYQGKTASVSVSVTDDDEPDLVVDPTVVTVGEDGSGSFSVRLATQPSGDVTVTVTSDDITEATVDMSSLEFTTTDWGTAQTVTVSGVHDADAADEMLSVGLSATGGDYAGETASVSVTVTDNNEAPTFTSAIQASVEENGSLSHTVVAVDDDAADSVTYAISPAADHPSNDQDSFEINQSTGALSFKSSVVLDYESGKTTYTVVVIATGGTGVRERTAEQTITVTVTNVEELPSKPDTPTVAAIGSDFVRIEWTAPTFVGPEISGYGVQYREDGAGAWIVWLHTGTATTAEITGLDAATDYEFQVRATNSDGDGPWSDALDATTEADDDCTADTATSCSVTVAGSASGEIGTELDVDWFAVVLDPGVAYKIYLHVGDTDEGELEDPQITGVYNSSGTLVSGSSDTDSGSGDDSLVVFEHNEAAAATYYVAAAWESGAVGTYRLWVARNNPDTSVSELSGQDLPNHPGTPGHVLLGDTVSGNRATSDVDFFGVSMKAGMSYRIDVRGECAADPAEDGGTMSDPYVELRRSDGTRTFTNLATHLNALDVFEYAQFVDDDSGACNNARMDIEALADGLHYIAVTAHSLGGTGTYTVAVTDITEYEVIEVAAGGSHSCARLENSGVVECWGLDDDGQSTVPSGESFAQVEAGPTASCGVTDGGEIECWGEDDSNNAFSPSSGTDFVWAGIGKSHGCGLESDGEVKCWGSNADSRSTPPSGATFTAISVGNEYSCGVKTDQSLACWGKNQNSRTDPPSTGQFTAVATGGSHACAIKFDGTVQCWGDSTDGRDDAGTATFASIDSHGDFSCGVKTDKSLHCWGSDSDDGRVSDVPGTGTYLMVGVGTHHACALAEDRSVRCWGANGNDELLPPMTLPGFNALPRFTSDEMVSKNEGAQFSHTVAAVDDDADDAANVSYGIAGGDDAALFEIDPSTGELTRSDGEPFDYEEPDDTDTDNSYLLVVRATSGTGNRERATKQHITVTVQNKPEPPAPDLPSLLDAGADYVRIRWVIPARYFRPPLTSVSVRYRKATEMTYTELLDVADSTDLGAFYGQVEITGLESGAEYMFSAQAFNLRGPGPWSAELTVTTPHAEDDCRADTMTSCSVTLGGFANGTFGVGGDVDWFAVDLESAVPYVVFLEKINLPGALPVTNPVIDGIYGSSGQLVEGSGNVEQQASSTSKYLRFVPGSTGKHFVAMTPRQNTDSGGYRLWVAQQLPGASVSESTTDLPFHAGTSGHVVVGSSATGEIEAETDADFFGVQLARDTTYRIEAKGECLADDGGDLPNPTMGVWTAVRGQPTAQQLEHVSAVEVSDYRDDNSGACSNALMDVRALQGGVYYLSVFTSSDGPSATGTYTVVVTQLADPAVVVVPESLPVTEGATATFEVSLAAEPTATVTVTVTSGDTGAATVSPSPLTFTTSDYATAQTVTVTAVEDDDAADEEVTITAVASGGNYDDLEAVVAVTVDDDETPTVEFNSTQLSVTEGSAGATYEVTLGVQPTTDVEVRITRAGRGVSASPWRLTFTPSDYATAQTVTVTGNDDSDADAHTVTLSHRAIGGEYESTSADVTVTVTDDDTTSVTLDTATADFSLAVDEGDSTSYTIVLDTRPSADVAVTVTPGSDKVVVLPSTVRFTDYDWHLPKTLTVTAVVDDDASDETTTLTHTAAGGGYDTVTIDAVTVSVADDDTAAVTVLPTSLTIDEGSSAVYVAVLDSEPSATVTVTPSVSGSEEVTVTPTPLTFTASNWNVAQTVTVSAATDTDTTEDTATISHTIAGGDYATVSVPDVSVSVTDGAALGITVSPTSLTIAEGEGSDYTIVLDAAPTGDVTVTLSVSDSDAVTVDVSELTFTTSDWQTEQTVAVMTTADTDVGDEAATITHTLSGGGYDSVAAPTVLVTVTDPYELPTMESVQAGDNGFLATWSPAAVRADSTITRYDIRYRRLNGGSWTTVNADTGTSFQVTGLSNANNANYGVAVRVVIDGVASDWSEPMQVRIGEPSAPTKLTVEGSESRLYIFWEPPANHELLTANGKRIRYFIRVRATGDPNTDLGLYTWDTHMSRAFTSEGAAVMNGTQYTVEVDANLYSADGANVLVNGGVATATGTPEYIDVTQGDFRHAVLRDTIEHVVATQEATKDADVTEWMRQAWNWVADQSAIAEQFPNTDWRTININVKDEDTTLGATVSYCASAEALVSGQTLQECYSAAIRIDLDHLCGATISASQYYACMDTSTATDLDPQELAANGDLIDTVIHELMHVYIATIREMTVNVGASALPVAVANLHSLATDRNLWTLPNATCAIELLAIVTTMILLGEFSGDYDDSCLGRTATVPLKCDDVLVAERCEVLRAMMKGEVAPWYDETYDGDADKLWADIVEWTTFDGVREPTVGTIAKLALLWGLAEEFGGYCSPLAANRAMFDSDTTIFNPWVDGGCEPDAPPTVTVTRGTAANTFEVSWIAPASEGGAPLSGYEVEWKRGNQSYSNTRRTPVAADVLTATIDVGANTSDHYFRVLAVNEIGESTGGEVTCTFSGVTWTCTFEAPAARSPRAGETQRWPANTVLPKDIVEQVD